MPADTRVSKNARNANGGESAFVFLPFLMTRCRPRAACDASGSVSSCLRGLSFG